MSINIVTLEVFQLCDIYEGCVSDGSRSHVHCRGDGFCLAQMCGAIAMKGVAHYSVHFVDRLMGSKLTIRAIYVTWQVPYIAFL